MDSLKSKVDKAVSVLRSFEPSDGYYLCYSGGKDSDCIRILAQLAGVKHEIHHSVTSVDAPETINYIKSVPNVHFDFSHFSDGRVKTMWNLIVKKKVPPSRVMRYCCEALKESGGKGRLKITGVRKSESRQRTLNGGLVKFVSKPRTVEKIALENSADYSYTVQGGIVLNLDNSASRRVVEHCYRTASTMINPLTDWDEEDVYNFLKYYNCASNPLYSCGFSRVGCVGCPMGGFRSMRSQFARYPLIRNNYIRAFNSMIHARIESGLTNSIGWNNGVDILRWWCGDDISQLSFFPAEYLRDIPDDLYKL